MSAHTPGPWGLGRRGLHVYYWPDTDTEDSHDASGHPVDVVLARAGGDPRMDPEVEAANMRLMHAAPDLLEALEELANRYPYKRANVLARARAAIAKARGEAASVCPGCGRVMEQPQASSSNLCGPCLLRGKP